MAANDDQHMQALEHRQISATVAALLATLQPRLYGFIFRRLADRDQTLEVLQRTNLVICEKAADFVTGTNFDAWAFTIARFQLMAWRKTQATSRLVFTDSVYDLFDRDTDGEAASATGNIEALRQCLKKLRPQDLSLVRQRYHDSRPLAAIAESLEKSIDAVGMRLSRIRHQLSDCIQETIRLKALDE
jgi:RNA polymerase sigma-70 factor (ECF subfamily)